MQGRCRGDAGEMKSNDVDALTVVGEPRAARAPRHLPVVVDAEERVPLARATQLLGPAFEAAEDDAPGGQVDARRQRARTAEHSDRAAAEGRLHVLALLHGKPSVVHADTDGHDELEELAQGGATLQQLLQ